MIIQGKRWQLDNKAAWILSEAVQTLLESKREVIMAVPGGRSVGGILHAFAKEPIEWHRVHLFMLDERLVATNHPESNFRLVAESLGETVAAASLHPFVYDAGRAEKGVAEYEQQLVQFGGKFDIVLASSGEDGHIASIFPHRQVTGISDRRFVLIEDSPKPPLRRMSATPATIAATQVGLLLFFGAEKGPALKNFLNPRTSITDCPAKLISTLPQHYILTDQEVTIR